MNNQEPALGITVGPVLYHWSRSELMGFYAGVADSAADCVVLGEVVCARRRELRLEDWLALARELSQAGKQVVLAGQALIESESDLRLLRRQAESCRGSGLLMEAGDASALQMLQGGPFVLGPHINIYSRQALEIHAALGATRWVAPLELSLQFLGQINPAADPVRTAAGSAIETEVFAFGRMPLAFSARCFTARHHLLNKDACEFRCLADPDGLLLRSSEGQNFLVLNGIQTQSAALQCLIGDGPALRAAGATRVRLSPCSQGFTEVIGLYDAVLNQGLSAFEGLRALRALPLPGKLANGYASGAAGMLWTRSETLTAEVGPAC